MSFSPVPPVVSRQSSVVGFPNLRLFDPDNLTPRPSPLTSGPSPLTLGQFYWSIARRGVARRQAAAGKSDRYLAELDSSIRLWCRVTGDPPLAEVKKATLNRWVETVVKPPVRGAEDDQNPKSECTLRPNTVRKHCRHLQSILKLAGPWEPGEEQEEVPQAGYFGVYEDGRPRWAPRFDKMHEQDDPPKAIYRLAELGLWLDACSVATRPELPGVEPAAWWRALVLFLHNTALRIETAIQVRWSHVSHDRGCWLVVPASLMKGRKHGAKIWLNPFALEAARGIRGEGAPGNNRLFAWPLSLRQLHRERKRMLAASRIEPDRRFGFHPIRRATLTRLAAINWAMAKLQSGHYINDVTLKYYVDPRIQKRVMDRFPQPCLSEVEPAVEWIDPQRRLFD
jgi:integrase